MKNAALVITALSMLTACGEEAAEQPALGPVSGGSGGAPAITCAQAQQTCFCPDGTMSGNLLRNGSGSRIMGAREK